MKKNIDVVAIGFGGCGFNIINEFSNTCYKEIKLAIVGDNDEHAQAPAEKITFYSFDKIEAAAQDFSNVRLCFLVGGLGGNSCTHIVPFAKKLREMGIVVVALVTFPLKFEGNNEKAANILELLQCEADAVLVFSNDEYMKKLSCGATMSTGMAASARDIMDCMLALNCSQDDLIGIDVEDLRSQLHGLVLRGIGRSRGSAATAARDAVEELKAHFAQNTKIGFMLTCIMSPTEKNHTEENILCCKIIKEAFPENPHSLLTAKKNAEGDGFTVVLLASPLA